MPSPAISSSNTDVGLVTRKMVRPGLPDYYVDQGIAKTIMAHRHPSTVINEKLPNGTRPMSPWAHDWLRVGCPPVFGRRQLGGGYYVEGMWNPWPVFLSPGYNTGPFPTELHHSWLQPIGAHEYYTDQVARTRVLNKISQQKMDLGTALLELKQTAGLVTQLATSLVNGVVNVVNARKSAAGVTNRFLRRLARGEDPYKVLASHATKDRRWLERARNAWMQYAFGLKPLVYDVKGAFDVLYDMLETDHDFLIRAKAGYEVERINSRYVGTLAPGGNTSANTRDTVQVHYSVVYKMPVGGVSFSELTGLNNGFATGWEVTRASWLFDYAIGVGDVLRGLTAANGLIFVEGCRSSIKRSILIDYEQDSPDQYSGQDPAGFIDIGSFRRELLPSTGVVPGVVPQIKTQLGLTQMGQALFALSSWLGGGKLPR